MGKPVNVPFAHNSIPFGFADGEQRRFSVADAWHCYIDLMSGLIRRVMDGAAGDLRS
jgi:hypothetical protein